MKFGLIGYGKMGKAIERLALEAGDEVVGRLTSKEQDFSLLQEADVYIDFTQPGAVLSHIECALSMNKPILIGTTGWEKDLALAKFLVEKSETSLLFAPNMSIGMYLFRQILKEVKHFLGNFPHYLPGGIEIHHEQKKDTPSGTAKLIAEDLGGVTFASVRLGANPGTHQLIFDSLDDTIELTHRARSRDGFTRGALEAARWLIGKKGFFTFDDFMKEKMTCNSKASLQHS